MILKILILIFGAFAVSRSYLRYRDRLLTPVGALFWASLWILIVLSVIFKEWTSLISQYFGIGRGADLLLFAAVLFLSYLSFRLYVRLEETRQEVTRLIRAIAIKEAEEPLDDSGNSPQSLERPESLQPPPTSLTTTSEPATNPAEPPEHAR